MLYPKFSIIITNYNYAAYLKRSIESALSQTYSNLEVVVVDDGSTDGSAAIASSFDGRVELVLKNHSGESDSRNTGFACSTGSLIMFLDSDDYLKSTAAQTVVNAWRSAYTKLQFHLQVVDEKGAENGLLIPRCRLDSGRVENLLLTSGRYITSPGSGNVYARSFLEKIVPIPTAEWPQSFDSYAATYAAFYGPIGAIEEPLGFYRVHSSNMTRITPNGKAHIEVAQLESLMGRGERLRTLIQKIARERGLPVASGIVISHWMYLKLKLAHLKLKQSTSRHEIVSCAGKMITSVMRSPELSPIKSFQLIAWTLGILLLPGKIAEPWIRVGFDLAPDNWLLRRLRRL